MAYQYKNDEGKRDSFTFDSCTNIAERREASDKRNREILINLIDLLVTKGVITEAEVVLDIFEERGEFEVAPE